MILLKFATEIKGTSKIKEHEHWIPVKSCSFNVERDVHTVGGGRSPSVAKFEAIEFSKMSDISSAELFIQSVAGNSLVSAKIHFIQTGGVGQPDQVYLKVVLDNPIITNYNFTGDADDQPQETFKVHFQRISYQYNLYDGSKVTHGTPKGWCCIKNEPWVHA